MLSRPALLVLFASCVAGCSAGKGQPPRQHPSSDPRDARSATDAAAIVAIPIVPEPLVAKLGSARVVLAIDNARPDSFPIADRIPAELACSRELVRAADIIVLLVSEDDHIGIYATGVSETAVRTCLPEWKRVAGVTSRDIDAGLSMVIGETEYELRWDASMLSAEPTGWSFPGAPATSLQHELIATLPTNTRIWAIARGFPPVSAGVDVMAVWFNRTETAARVTLIARGDDAALESSVGGVIRGMKKQAIENGMSFDESWLKVSVVPGAMTVELTIPAALLGRIQSRP